MKKKIIPGIMALSLLFSGCGQVTSLKNATQMQKINDSLKLTPAPSFYGTTYEIFTGSFCDSDGDGIGDLKGITKKLDYINDGDDSTVSDLGVDRIWLTPIHESSTYHKYDVNDYRSIDHDFGTMEDFDELIAECDKRGLGVIMDLVINHSGSGNDWFVKATDYLKTLGKNEKPDINACPYVDYYNFSRQPQDGYAKLEGTDWYYEARFADFMPDLNLDSNALREEFTDIARFWLEKGVAGFRMDAVLYFYTDDNQKNIEFMKWFNDMVKSIRPEAYVVGEAWAARSVYGSYYDSGFDSYFDFSFAGAEGIIAKTANGSYSAADYVSEQIKEDELFSSHNPAYINAPFYTNHDLPRSAGYFSGDNGDKTKLAGGLNLLMSGNAFIYYGEELGMKGSGKDENKRAPMLWSTAGAEGMTDGPADMDSFEQKYDPYDIQKDDALSIFEYYRNAVRLRSSYPAIAAGDCILCDSLSEKDIAVYAKILDGEAPVIIAINTSKESREVTLSNETDFGGTALSDTVGNISDIVLGGVLITGTDEVKYKDGSLTLPPYGIAVLKGSN